MGSRRQSEAMKGGDLMELVDFSEMCFSEFASKYPLIACTVPLANKFIKDKRYKVSCHNKKLSIRFSPITVKK